MIFKKINHKLEYLRDRVRLNKKVFILYTVLRALVIFTAVRCFIEKNFESFALCLFSLVLFLLPAFFEEKLKVRIPPLFEALIYLFIFASEILGEVNRYYTEVPGWDTMLHTINGFLCAAIGFALVDILNRGSKKITLSPIYMAVVAFCFSMTVGVVWEFFEFFMDQMFYLDMQKDYIVHTIGSVTLDPTHTQTPYVIRNITKTIIETASGNQYVIDGYLDIGIIDTMKDLFVNFIGAFVFSVIGYLYEKKRLKKNVADRVNGLILTTMTNEELEEQQKKILEQEEKLRQERHRRLNSGRSQKETGGKEQINGESK